MAYRHLSLKARLRLGTILLVTSLVALLAGLNLHRAIEGTFASLEARALTNAAQIRDFLVDRIANQAAAALPRPTNFTETRQLWTSIIREDQQLADLLVKAVANSSLIAGIYITDDQRRILNASHPVGAQGLAPVLPDFLTLQKSRSLNGCWKFLPGRRTTSWPSRSGKRARRRKSFPSASLPPRRSSPKPSVRSCSAWEPSPPSPSPSPSSTRSCSPICCSAR